jgi:hypothetical protein
MDGGYEPSSSGIQHSYPTIFQLRISAACPPTRRLFEHCGNFVRSTLQCKLMSKLGLTLRRVLGSRSSAHIVDLRR